MKKHCGLTRYQLDILNVASKGDIIRDDWALEQTTIAHAPLRRDVLLKLYESGLLEREVEKLPPFSRISPREIYRLTEKGRTLLEEIRKQ